MLSQSPENSTLSSMADSNWDSTTNLDQSITENFSGNNLGLTSSSGINLNGILTAENSAQTSLELSKLGAATDSTSNYSHYLNSSTETGSLLDSKG